MGLTLKLERTLKNLIEAYMNSMGLKGPPNLNLAHSGSKTITLKGEVP